MYNPWLREGPLYKSVLNKCKGFQTFATIQVISGTLLNSGLRHLFRYGTSHFWDIIKFRPEALVQIWHTPDHKWET